MLPWSFWFSSPTMQVAHGHWQPIGRTSNQLILYHPPSHALTVQPHSTPETDPAESRRERSSTPRLRQRPLLLPYRSATPLEIPRPTCPYCSQILPSTPTPATGAGIGTSSGHAAPAVNADLDGQPAVQGGYFQILEKAHEMSRPSSPRLRERTRSATPMSAIDIDDQERDQSEDGLEDEDSLPAKGYYERYFREEKRLGMGAEGSVFLATHIIGGNVLGTYAVKKIAVGSSKEYLVKMLREVRLLETLRHPNVIPYHHAWIDKARFSTFAPPITALHVLMMYATAGNLDTFLITRSHSTQPNGADLSAGGIADGESLSQLPKAERIKAFKKRRQSGGNARREETRGVLLLGLEEVATLFGDVVEGLAFLHGNSILHLDLKCSNVLLHWEEGKLIPKAMISDFGTSEEMLRGKRQRTGHTGTLEYMAPEILVTGNNGEWRPSDSHADMWSLGMILHKLLFLHLPYPDTEDFSALEPAILSYPGFTPTPELVQQCESRHIPRDWLVLLSKLLDINPDKRPSADKVRKGIKQIKKTPKNQSGLGGMVTRFYPFGRDIPVPEQNGTATWQDVSPVRSFLALPSPVQELHSPLPLVPQDEERLWDHYVRTSLFIIKILSLQPAFTGLQLGMVPTMILVISALAGLYFDTWLAEAATASLHLALLVGSISASASTPLSV